MAHQPDTTEEVIDQLWKRLDDTRAGMLALDGSEQHAQPMTHFADKNSGAIWFITSSDTDLVAAMGNGAASTFIYVSDEGDYHASIKGHLAPSSDSKKLDELWSMPVAAWFEKGRDDPKVRLLKLDPTEAAIWASQGSAILVGIKMLNAALREDVSEPDVGQHHIVRLSAA